MYILNDIDDAVAVRNAAEHFRGNCLHHCHSRKSLPIGSEDGPLRYLYLIFSFRGRRQLPAFCFKRTMFVWEGGGLKLVRLEEKSAFMDCCVWFCTASWSFRWRRNSLTLRSSWPSPRLSTSSAELTRDIHDLAPSLALSVMRRTNGGRYAPTPLKKKHEKSPSGEPGTSQAFPKILRRSRHHHVYRIT